MQVIYANRNLKDLKHVEIDRDGDLVEIRFGHEQSRVLPSNKMLQIELINPHKQFQLTKDFVKMWFDLYEKSNRKILPNLNINKFSATIFVTLHDTSKEELTDLADLVLKTFQIDEEDVHLYINLSFIRKFAPRLGSLTSPFYTDAFYDVGYCSPDVDFWYYVIDDEIKSSNHMHYYELFIPSNGFRFCNSVEAVIPDEVAHSTYDLHLWVSKFDNICFNPVSFGKLLIHFPQRYAKINNLEVVLPENHKDAFEFIKSEVSRILMNQKFTEFTKVESIKVSYEDFEYVRSSLV